MFAIEKNREGDTLTLVIKGILNTKTAPDLTRELNGLENDYKTLIFEFSELDYLTSAGLRVLLQAEQDAEDNGRQMIVRHVSKEIMDIFTQTGFIDVLTIE